MTTPSCALNGQAVSSSNQPFRFAFLFAAILFTITQFNEVARAATITVRAGGDFQAALNAAQSGDVITLEAGATFTGPFTLPNKTGVQDYITVRTSAPDSELPAANARITPAYANRMPKIVSPGGGQAALQTAQGAHHFRFVGVEFKPANKDAFIYDLIRLGDESHAQDTLDKVPHHLILDRCYIHADPQAALKRGVALNSAHTSIINSYLESFKAQGQDSQAICGWNGPGPFQIVNNYLEGAGENVMFGGDTPAIKGLIPSDIEIRGNHFVKPWSWRQGHPSYAGTPWSIKNLFELKNAQRIVIEGNLFENSWAHAQEGFAIVLSPSNEGGAVSWATVRDLRFVGNVVRHCASAINIKAKTQHADQELVERLTIRDNLFYDINHTKYGGRGTLLLMTGSRDVTIEHNTIQQSRLIAYAYSTPSTGFVFRNNITNRSEWGFMGDGYLDGWPSLDVYAPGAVFERNVVIGDGSAHRHPDTNFFVDSIERVGFTNPADANYQLQPTSPFVNRATDGTDIGCKFTLLNAAFATTSSAATLTAPPAVSTPAPITSPAPSASSSSALRIYTATGNGSSEGLVLNQATLTREAFDAVAQNGLATDGRTRLMIFASGISSSAANTNANNDVRTGNQVIANVAESVTVEARMRDGRTLRLPVEYAGVQGSVAGLDQVHVALLSELRGAGQVELTVIVGGHRSNSAVINVR